MLEYKYDDFLSLDDQGKHLGVNTEELPKIVKNTAYNTKKAVHDKFSDTYYEDRNAHLPGTTPTSKEESANIFDYAISNGYGEKTALQWAKHGMPKDQKVEWALKNNKKIKNPYRD